MGYSGEDKADREGIGTVCRVCQTNGAGPHGKEIIMGSVSVKHVKTKKKEREVGMPGGPEAVPPPVRAHKESGSPEQHRPCQRMSVIRRLTEVIPRLSPALQQALYCQQCSKRKTGGGHQGSGEVVFFLSLALRLFPTIVQNLQLQFSDLLCGPVDSGY